MPTEDLWTVVRLGENSQLKTDLNKAVAMLSAAPETHFWPHVCLNDEDGVRVLGEITPTSDTEFHLHHYMIASGDDVWLNIILYVYLDNFCYPTNVAKLSPRQSAFVIANLPAESRTAVLAKAKRWYLEKFLADMAKGFDRITEQFENGDPLLESDYLNRIFDIHGERNVEVPYTEWGIVGDKLFGSVFHGDTCLEYEQDGYARTNQFIIGVRARQKAAVDYVRKAMRGVPLHQ